MIGISGASGNLGRLTARGIAEHLGDPSDLVLTTRQPDAVADLVPGAQVRFSDFDDSSSMTEAFEGLDSLLLISSSTVEGRSEQHAAAIDAAVAAGVGHVIYTSMLSPGPTNPALISESHWATEEHLRASDVEHTILRFSLYSDFQVFEAMDALATGRFVHNRGTGGCSYIAREDCARVAAAVLSGGASHRGKTYELTGPESLDAVALAALYSEAGGREVEAVAVDDDEFLRLLGAENAAGNDDGHVQYGVALTVSLGRAIREGHFSAVTTSAEELTGAAPRTVASVLGDSAEMLRAVEPS
ncbi:MAG: NAD(P)H-binding protein [Cryobacterium sp.]|nr:NAD(P)H-binding protein [Cryobacterium sp.]